MGSQAGVAGGVAHKAWNAWRRLWRSPIAAKVMKNRFSRVEVECPKPTG